MKDITKGAGAFFVYVTMTDVQQSGLNLMGVCCRDNATLQPGELLRLQNNLFNGWLNHLKSSSKVETLLQDIPEELWEPALARPGLSVGSVRGVLWLLKSRFSLLQELRRKP